MLEYACFSDIVAASKLEPEFWKDTEWEGGVLHPQIHSWGPDIREGFSYQHNSII